MAKSFSTARVRWMLMVFLFMFTPTIILAEAPKINPLGLLAWTMSTPMILLQDNVEYFPLQPLALLLNANTATDPATGKVTIQYGNIRFTCKPDSTAATVSRGDNQLETELLAPPCVRAGTIYIPIRPLLQTFEIEESYEHFRYKFQLPGMDSPMEIGTRAMFPINRETIVQLPDVDSDLYIVNPDGSGLMRLSYENMSVKMPDMFPDGKAIMERSGMALSLETGEEWRVFGEEGKDTLFHGFAFSADGKLVAATNGSVVGGVVLLANTDGTEQHVVVTDAILNDLSSDGKFLTFIRKGEFFLLDIEQMQSIALGKLSSAIFSPTDPIIAVTQPQKINIANNIIEMRYYMFTYTYAGPEKGKISKLPDAYFSLSYLPYTQFSPDGKQIVFTRINNNGLLLATTDLQQVIPLIRTRKVASRPVFTADGKQIIFCFDSALYIMDIDGKNPKVISPADTLYVNNSLYEANRNDSPFRVLPDGRILFIARRRSKTDGVPLQLR